MIGREVGIFLVVGSLTVFVDFLAYSSLVWVDLFSVDWAKAIGFLSGTGFAYFANRHWTFSHTTHGSGSNWRFLALYAFTLGVNVIVNSVALDWFADIPVATQISFVVATGVSSALNFLGMKFYVFRRCLH